MRWIRRAAVAAAALLIVVQFVPYGWEHSNPPVMQNAPWPSDQSRSIAVESCYACHSNETDWPAYSYVAPFSWLVRRDVESGRDELNFSDWAEASDELDDAVESVEEGEMPPRQYTAIHRDASLTSGELETLVAALRSMGSSSSEDEDGDESG